MDKFTISLPMINDWLTNDGRWEVTIASPRELREALERFARFFKMEMGYDMIQYWAEEGKNPNPVDPDIPYHGFVFTETAHYATNPKHPHPPTILVGGCCFRRRECTNHSYWELDWIWLHPFRRNRGILSKHWPFFVSEFGKFRVARPHSLAMEKFLHDKAGDRT